MRCQACAFVAWGNSVPAVLALVERDGRLLLARRALEPGRGLWDIPGGFLEEGEHPIDGLRRELHEETGLELESASFVEAWLDPYDGRTVPLYCIDFDADNPMRAGWTTGSRDGSPSPWTWGGNAWSSAKCRA